MRTQLDVPIILRRVEVSGPAGAHLDGYHYPGKDGLEGLEEGVGVFGGGELGSKGPGEKCRGDPRGRPVGAQRRCALGKGGG